MGRGICLGDGTSAEDGSGDKPTLESAGSESAWRCRC